MWRSHEAPIVESVHLEASFINHRCARRSYPEIHCSDVLYSCLPTCFVEWSDFSVKIVSLTPLEKGDELTISYADFNSKSTHESRKQYLLKNYQFTCTCPLCSMDPAAQEYFETWLQCPACLSGILRPDKPGDGDHIHGKRDLRSCSRCFARYFRDDPTIRFEGYPRPLS